MSYETNFQIGVKASPEDVYKALTEPKRLAQWWTDTRGNSAKVSGTRIRLYTLFEVLEANGDHHVLSVDGLAVRHGGANPTALTVRPVESLDKDREGINLLLFLKPLRVGQVELERERFNIGGR